MADWLIYTDADPTPPRLRALLFRANSPHPDIRALCSASVHVARPYLFRRTNLIFGLELLALVLFFEDWAPFLRGRWCWVYVDNNDCLAALTRGIPMRKSSLC